MIDPTGKRMTRNAALDELRAIARTRATPEAGFGYGYTRDVADWERWEIELQTEPGIRYWEGE